VLEYDQGGDTFQVVWKRMGAGKGLDNDEARAMRERLAPYRKSLELGGWQIPKLFFSAVEKLGSEFQGRIQGVAATSSVNFSDGVI
jgi:hypothetical protein